MADLQEILNEIDQKIPAQPVEKIKASDTNDTLKAIAGFADGKISSDEKGAFGGVPVISDVTLKTTIAEIRELTGAVRSTLLYTTDTKKEGTWKQVNGEFTSADDNTGTFIVDQMGRGYQRVHGTEILAEWFGIIASPDGLTDLVDNTDAISKLFSVANNSESIVRFPFGWIACREVCVEYCRIKEISSYNANLGEATNSRKTTIVPFEDNQRYIWKFGGKSDLSEVDDVETYSCKGLKLKVNFSTQSSTPGKIKQVTDSCLILECFTSGDLELGFYEINGRALRTKNFWETRIRDLAFRRINNFGDTLWLMDNANYEIGANTSEVVMDGITIGQTNCTIIKSLPNSYYVKSILNNLVFEHNNSRFDQTPDLSTSVPTRAELDTYKNIPLFDLSYADGVIMNNLNLNGLNKGYLYKDNEFHKYVIYRLGGLEYLPNNRFNITSSINVSDGNATTYLADGKGSKNGVLNANITVSVFNRSANISSPDNVEVINLAEEGFVKSETNAKEPVQLKYYSGSELFKIMHQLYQNGQPEWVLKRDLGEEYIYKNLLSAQRFVEGKAFKGLKCILEMYPIEVSNITVQYVGDTTTNTIIPVSKNTWNTIVVSLWSKDTNNTAFNVRTTNNTDVIRIKSLYFFYEQVPDYTPVQQGTGTGQTTTPVKIGWNGADQLRVMVNNIDFGTNWPINISGYSKWDSSQFTGNEDIDNILTHRGIVCRSEISSQNHVLKANPANKIGVIVLIRNGGLSLSNPVTITPDVGVLINSSNSPITLSDTNDAIILQLASSNTWRVLNVNRGLVNVDNTRDLDKPVSEATQQAISNISGGFANAVPGDTPIGSVNTYNANIAGTYINFGGIVVSASDMNSGVVQLRRNGASWTKVVIQVDPSVGLRGIRMDLFKDYSGSTLTETNKGLARGLRDVFVKSKSATFNDYSIRYLRRGSDTIATAISLFNYVSDTSSAATVFSIGIVGGVQDYVWINQTNGDEVYFTIDWDKTDLAAGEQREVTKGRMLLSKSLYYYAGSPGGAVPGSIELLLPDIIPVAQGIFLPVFSESIRNLSTIEERNTRVDISGGGITVPHSNYAQPWKYQFNGAPGAQFNVSVSNKTLDGIEINSGTFAVKPVASVFNSATEVPILLLGSSSIDIANAIIGRELRATIIAKNSFIPKFIGTRSGTQGGVTVNHEGYPGATTKDFLSATLPIGSSTTVPNPFYIGGAFDFSAYMAANGFTACNHLYIRLLTNDIYLIADGTITANDVVNNLKAIIQSAWVYNSNMNCSIILSGLGDMTQDSGALIKTRLVSLFKVVKAAFVGDVFKSPTNKAAKLCNVFQSVDRVNGYGTTSASRTGLSFPFDSTHNNTDQYRGESDMIFSHLLMDLNS